MEIWNLYRADIQLGLVIALVLASIRAGASPERWMSGALLWMLVSDDLYFWLLGHQTDLETTDLGIFLIDLSVLAIMIPTALRANRMYTLWMAAFQILATFAHLARSMTEAISPIAYAIMYIGPSYFQIIILACGIFLHQKRVKHHGSYRSWRTSSNHSQGTKRRN